MRTAGVLALLALVTAVSGCITRAGGALQSLNLPPALEPAALEHSVGDFEFTLEGGKMVSSNKMGVELNKEILKRWKKKGYIGEITYVESSQFTGKADYNLTLSGSQYGDSSIMVEHSSKDDRWFGASARASPESLHAAPELGHGTAPDQPQDRLQLAPIEENPAAMRAAVDRYCSDEGDLQPALAAWA